MTVGGTFNLLFAGDAFIVKPWSKDADPAFLALIDLIRSADAAVTNLETVIHEFKGYAQADSGGTYAHSPPGIAGELAWAGFDLVAHANNHTFDYGSAGVLETLEHVERAGLVLAGSGRDLRDARAPRYVERNGVRIGLVAMASTYILYGRASDPRPGVLGRPGLNPLAVHLPRLTLSLPSPLVEYARRIGRRFGKRFNDLGPDGFEFGLRMLNGRTALFRDRWSQHRDRNANLAAIAEAATKADIVVASIHAHFQGRWLRAFAIEAIDRGASIVFIHGPHELRGIEVHCGRPILYSLGDFVYQADSVDRHPSDAYERLKLGDDADVKDLRAAPGPVRDLAGNRAAFEGVIASIEFAGRNPERIRLYPIDLGFNATDGSRGRPRLAGADVGRRIIAEVGKRSNDFGARIAYDAGRNLGEIDLRSR